MTCQTTQPENQAFPDPFLPFCFERVELRISKCLQMDEVVRPQVFLLMCYLNTSVTND